jgi:hypothetical protein
MILRNPRKSFTFAEIISFIMKNFFFTILVGLFLTIQLPAQIHLIGARINESTGGIDIATWHAEDPASALFYPTMLTGYYLASSVFDAYRSNYYLTGITGTSDGLFSFNSLTYEQNISPFTNFSNITEIDMSTGKIYNLTTDSSDYFTVNEYDILSGTESILGVIHEPGANGIVVDAISFNSNNGILLYLGFDGLGNKLLYSISVREPVFTYTKTIVQAPTQNPIMSLAYDNVNDLLFALQFGYNGGTNTPDVVEINTSTGDVISRGTMAEFYGFVAGSSCFDQLSGSYLLVGIDTANLTKLIIFNTYSNSYVTKEMPGNVSEILCDNYSFARSAYGTTGVAGKEKAGITIYPNPATSKIFVSVNDFEGPMIIKLFNLLGKECYSGAISGTLTEVPVHGLEKGIYFAQIFDNNLIQSIKIVIQ